jgi:hypothetical protein
LYPDELCARSQVPEFPAISKASGLVTNRWLKRLSFMADRHLLDRCTAFGVGDPAICTVRGLLDDGGRLLAPPVHEMARARSAHTESKHKSQFVTARFAR